MPRLMHAFRQKLSQDMFGLSPLSSWPLRSPALAIRGYWRGAISTLNLLAPLQSCFLKLLAWQDTHPNPSLPASAPHRRRYFSQTLSNVRGRLRPTLELVSQTSRLGIRPALPTVQTRGAHPQPIRQTTPLHPLQTSEAFRNAGSRGCF
jgi:hypothetical protein